MQTRAIGLASTGGGDEGYELQILDNYNNNTYVNGQAGSIYKQFIPLANANKKPGEWQTYDVVWTAPTFNADGTFKSAARVTAFLNGVLVQNNITLEGPTQYIGKASYKKAHGATPIKLQDHGDPSEPISFRNIWIRELQAITRCWLAPLTRLSYNAYDGHTELLFNTQRTMQYTTKPIVQ